MTNYESLWIIRDVSPSALAIQCPTSKALYSTSFLVVGYCKRVTCLSRSLSSDSNITPTHPTNLVDDPSMLIVHLGSF
jgi:hypothetical protein